jgi:hypothetical protein
MSAPTLTKAERAQRLRYVRGGQWNDAILVMHDGTEWYCIEATVWDSKTGEVFVTGYKRPRLEGSDLVMDAYMNVADVANVIR